MLFHTRTIALAAALAVCAAGSAFADDWDDCRQDAIGIRKEDRSYEIRACDTLIYSGRYSGKHLSALYAHRANGYYTQRDDELAFADYTRAMELNGGNAFARNGRGNVFLNKKQYDAALAEYNAAIRIDPKHAHAYNGRGLVYEALGKRQEALKEYTRAIGLAQRDVFFANRGLTRFSLKEFDSAKLDFEQALALNPRYSLAHNELGRIALIKRDYKDAIARFTQAIEADGSSWAYFSNRAIALHALGEYVRAIADLNRALELNPRADDYNSRGNAYYALKEYPKAIADYEATLRLMPNSPGTYRNIGNVYRDTKEYDKALKAFGKAIEQGTDFAAAYSDRGDVYYETQQNLLALADYTKALSIRPLAWDYQHRADVYGRLGRWSEALPDWIEAKKLSPENAMYMNGYAWALVKSGRGGEGLADIQKALAKEPDNADYLDTRGHVFEALGKRDEAIADFKRALSINPAIEASKAGLKRLGTS